MTASDNVLTLQSLIDTLTDHPLIKIVIEKIVEEELVLINAYGRAHGDISQHSSLQEMLFFLTITGLISDYIQIVEKIEANGTILNPTSPEARFGCDNVSGNIHFDGQGTAHFDMYSHARANESTRSLSLIFAKNDAKTIPVMIANLNFPNFNRDKLDTLVIKDANGNVLADHSVTSDTAWTNQCINVIREIYSDSTDIQRFTEDLKDALEHTEEH